MSTGTPLETIRHTPTHTFVRARSLPGSDVAARKAIERAVREHLLFPVRPGLYYRSPMTRYGLVRPDPVDVAREVLGPVGFGLASYSAAHAWGLTTQVPAETHVSTLSRARGIPGVVIHARSNFARVALGEREVALLELLRAPEVLVEHGWPALVAAVASAVEPKEIDINAVSQAGHTERSSAVSRNLQQLLADLDRQPAPTEGIAA